jgi:hypothetical protein
VKRGILLCLIPILIIASLIGLSAYMRYERCEAQGGQYTVLTGSCDGLVKITINPNW